MTRSRQILLVDDNPDEVALTLCALQRAQVAVQVDVAGDGPEVLEYLFGTGRHAGRDAGQLPCLILLDVNLPGINGKEVLRQLRNDPRTKWIPVIMLTTSREECDVRESYGNGANSYICKPVDFEEFTTMIQDLTRYWLNYNEVAPAGESDFHHGCTGRQ